MYSCLLMEVMMINKYCKFHSYISVMILKKVRRYEKLNQGSTSNKGH